MRAVDMILKKRRGEAHSREELAFVVGGYVRGEIPDYQISAWLMAVCFKGMTPQETADLTQLMADSGETLDLSSLPRTVDKHSTGGVGDKTSLVLAPLLAACGTTIAKMSGRGLGHTGGTVDKLESIPGFNATLSEAELLKQAQEVGVAITGQSKDLAPADGVIYALRDASGTVESLPLIASSIMSKKLAGGAQSLVLDVKVGCGAFMKTLPEARELALTMIDIGKRAGKNVRAVISNMEEPLGRAVGNALEVIESIQCLKGEGPEDLTELCLILTEEVLAAAGVAMTRDEIRAKLHNGEAYTMFERWIAAQGGDVASLEGLELAPDRYELAAPADGFVSRLDALKVGEAVKVLGGGRSKKDDVVDMGVGIVLNKKIGDKVATGDSLMTIYHRGGKGLDYAQAVLGAAVTLSTDEPEVPPLVLQTLG